MSFHVLKPGLQTTPQDGGRHGHAALGVGAAGAMDDVALRLANALVGNAPGAAALEMTLTGPELRFDRDVVIALTGAGLAARCIAADGSARPVPMWQPVRVRAGNVLDCGRVHDGARSYLAIGGGLAVARVMGSAATDINAGLGPLGGRALLAGDVVPIGDAVAARSKSVSQESVRKPGITAKAESSPQTWSLDPRPWTLRDPDQPIRLIRDRHFDALDEVSRARLFDCEFRIAAESNRVGLRLEGPRLTLSAPMDLVSEPVANGTVQLPPDGRAIALMVEHPTTGGYPRIGQIAAIDLPRLGQCRPGDCVRFAPIEVTEAQTRYLARERELARLIEAMARRQMQ